MKERLLQYLACPACAHELALNVSQREGREIMTGELRCTACAASYVIGVDLSVAVESAYRNTRDLENAHIIQADIYHLPLRSSFDYAFSVGVLHHLPDPRGGFEELVRHVRPGGAVSAWIYGRENNGWIVHLINPLRRHFTSKLPTSVLY